MLCAKFRANLIQMWLYEMRISKEPTQGCIQTSRHNSKLATRSPCTTLGDQTYASTIEAKVEMESWFLDLVIKVLKPF